MSPDPDSTNKIDVLIPAVDKDLGTLPHVIDAVRKMVRHPIGRIWIVSPDSAKIKALCRKKGCHFVHERKVLPFTKQDVVHKSRTWDRSGWLYQQLLKLNGDKVCQTPRFLVIDADTVLIRPHVFISGPNTIFYCRNWSQPEYFRSYRRLLGKKPLGKPSFVAHYMLFEKSRLAKLKQTIEARHGTRWYEAILHCIDKTRPYAFSEFETYGNYFHAMTPDQMKIRKTLNKSLGGTPAAISPSRMARLARKYRSLSFHKRRIYSRKRQVLRR
jgi:hypothetical protein